MFAMRSVVLLGMLTAGLGLGLNASAQEGDAFWCNAVEQSRFRAEQSPTMWGDDAYEEMMTIVDVLLIPLAVVGLEELALAIEGILLIGKLIKQVFFPEEQPDQVGLLKKISLSLINQNSQCQFMRQIESGFRDANDAMKQMTTDSRFADLEWAVLQDDWLATMRATVCNYILDNNGIGLVQYMDRETWGNQTVFGGRDDGWGCSLKNVLPADATGKKVYDEFAVSLFTSFLAMVPHYMASMRSKYLEGQEYVTFLEGTKTKANQIKIDETNENLAVLKERMQRFADDKNILIQEQYQKWKVWRRSQLQVVYEADPTYGGYVQHGPIKPCMYEHTFAGFPDKCYQVLVVIYDAATARYWNSPWAFDLYNLVHGAGTDFPMQSMIDQVKDRIFSHYNLRMVRMLSKVATLSRLVPGNENVVPQMPESLQNVEFGPYNYFTAQFFEQGPYMPDVDGYKNPQIQTFFTAFWPNYWCFEDVTQSVTIPTSGRREIKIEAKGHLVQHISNVKSGERSYLGAINATGTANNQNIALNDVNINGVEWTFYASSYISSFHGDAGLTQLRLLIAGRGAVTGNPAPDERVGAKSGLVVLGQHYALSKITSIHYKAFDVEQSHLTKTEADKTYGAGRIGLKLKFTYRFRPQIFTRDVIESGTEFIKSGVTSAGTGQDKYITAYLNKGDTEGIFVCWKRYLLNTTLPRRAQYIKARVQTCGCDESTNVSPLVNDTALGAYVGQTHASIDNAGNIEFSTPDASWENHTEHVSSRVNEANCVDIPDE